MGVSVISEQRDLILDAIKSITRGDVRLLIQQHVLYLLFSQWKVLVIDEGAKKIIDNVVKEDDILNENIASKEHIHGRRSYANCRVRY